MKLQEKAADFTLQTDEDKTTSLSNYAGRPVVLFFYPRADIPGCTIEACGFRDAFQKIQAAGAVVLGISRDTHGAQAKFRAKYNLPYTLLADVDEKVCNQFGILKEKNYVKQRLVGQPACWCSRYTVAGLRESVDERASSRDRLLRNRHCRGRVKIGYPR